MTYNTINDAQTIADMLLAGRYRVVRPLGKGGMGSVWLAEDIQLDNKQFAIKMLPSILVSNKRAYRQLKDEALVAMRLVHPNIVQIRAFEENNGNPFLVMDYIEGQTLDDYLAEKGKLSENEVLSVLRPIAAALDYAHGEGVVHRDVKPANVMIRKDGHPFILDFGVAREIQETMTRVTGKLSSGTLLYMSPEQLMGESPKSAQDVYSFAAMAYECLKGEPPFVHGQIEFQIMNKPPNRLLDGVRMSASIMRGLSKRPENRPDSCVKVLQAVSSVRHIPSARPLVAVPPRRQAVSMTDRIVVRRKRNVVGIIVPLSCLIVSLLALGGALWYREVQRQEMTRGQASWIQQEETLHSQAEYERKAQEEGVLNKTDAQRRVNEGSERKRKAEEARLAAERSAKESATVIRTNAKIQQGKVARISDADGFKARKDSLEDVFIRAEAFYDENTKRWAEAEALYRDYIEQSKHLISFDGDRQQTVAKRSAVQASFRKAEEAGAKTYARQSWNAAVKTWNVAAAEFGRMEFSAAAVTFAKAQEEFEGCAKEAEANRRTAEERRMEKNRQAERKRRKNWPAEGREFTINRHSLYMTMKWCPAGTFTMGSPESEEGRDASETQHQVTITKGFWMGETEVTQGQWKRLMDNETIVDLVRKMLMDDTEYMIIDRKQTMRTTLNKSKYDDPQGMCGDVSDDMPVYWVSWNDAVRFCRKLTAKERAEGRIPDGYEYRLPTEAEWEYACRAGETASLPNGKNIRILGAKNAPALDDIAWYGGNSSEGFYGRGWDTSNWTEKQYPGGRAAAREVKGKRPNNWGLYDMIGNVWEWCEDWYGDYPYGSAIDPTGAKSGVFRVLRGGSWRIDALYCRSARRATDDPGWRDNHLGFRVVLAPKLE